MAAAAASSCIMSLSSTVTYTEVEEQNLDKKKKKKDDDDDDDEYIELLLSRESRFCCTTCDSSSPPSSVESSSRPDAVRWIVMTQASLGFSMKTAYLAVTYLDHFFKHRTIDLTKGKRWAIQLLSVACLSLAAKMEECKAAALSELETEDYHFEAETIQRMELLVLSTLEWRMRTVTPFPFLSYLACKFRQQTAEDLVCRAIELIFASIQAINLDYRASVVAAAAILAASDGGLTQQSLKSHISATSSLRSMDLDAVSACYSMMIQESMKEKPRTPKALAAANCSSLENSSDARNGAISSAAGANNKRRRLRLLASKAHYDQRV